MARESKVAEKRSASAKRGAPPVDRIDPKEWHLTGSIVYDGAIHSNGEPPPPMLLSEARNYQTRGLMARIGDETPDRGLPAQAPTTPADYLRATDVMVLRLLRQFPTSDEDLHDLHRQAVRTGRSALLIEALAALARLPVEVGR